jgi:uncharacterized protein YecT (DUF1311 family)
MNYNNLSRYVVTCLIVFSSSAMAKNTMLDCEEKTATTTELSRCLDNVKEKKDRELQTWVNNQTFILEELVASNGRRATINMFKRSQRDFISYRENNCRWQYLVVAPDPSAASAYKKCYITLTQYRIEELSNLN